MSLRIKWYEPYFFYFFELPDGIKKFGVTNNLKKRKAQYYYQGLEFKEFIFIDKIDKGWKAYLYEQVVRYMCDRFISKGVCEWVKPSIPKEVIINAYHKVKLDLSFDLYRYEHIHKKDYQDQKAYYRQLANMLGGYYGKVDDWV